MHTACPSGEAQAGTHPVELPNLPAQMACLFTGIAEYLIVRSWTKANRNGLIFAVGPVFVLIAQFTSSGATLGQSRIPTNCVRSVLSPVSPKPSHSSEYRRELLSQTSPPSHARRVPLFMCVAREGSPK